MAISSIEMDRTTTIDTCVFIGSADVENLGEDWILFALRPSPTFDFVSATNSGFTASIVTDVLSGFLGGDDSAREFVSESWFNGFSRGRSATVCVFSVGEADSASEEYMTSDAESCFVAGCVDSD
jgi:hypothetical protein